MPPEGSDSHSLVPEWSAEFGLRFGLGSDLASREQGHITDRPGGEREVP
jgi:hypothetical protein